MIIDPSALEAYREVMEDEADEFIADVLNSFYTNARELLATMDSALLKNNVDEFVRAAHTFKSTAATVGANPLSGLLADLEKRGESEGLSALKPLIPPLKEAFDEVEKKLKEIFS
ncbi:MAG: Hpt domain-containing protein [Anaerolineae bacterium]|jgi:HPt (histidine-containing phosphotransfer) domain-containing protein|nr:Hpt domain-containing protein [Anaerolineae bacterium]MBT4310483.1 Hpt domain-containing protein [Anaerolineae bacterium]MBT4459235.1 Hpt domain-containing protein [Anaerolineae bacterium]MBT4841053.1 Hpt domain-containing protein [Anaerolineae bacterium]MBT6060624.1 Hpt domain-containing protein [Anaerolineae bacterium]